MRAAIAQALEAIGPAGTHALVFGLALLVAYGLQPLPDDGGIRAASWWRHFRAMFRRRRRYRDGGFTGPPPPLHPNCRCIIQPIEDARMNHPKPRTYAPAKPAAEVPAIELAPVESSQLEAFGYDPERQLLAIRFHGHGGKPGSLYHYANFGETDYAALRDAESKGSHFIRNIKPHADRYPCYRVIETAAP